MRLTKIWYAVVAGLNAKTYAKTFDNLQVSQLP